MISAARTSGNQRRFHEVDACIIKIVRVAQRVGLSVAEIHELISGLPDRRAITMDDWYDLPKALEDEVRSRIRALTVVLDDLTTEPRLCEVPT